MGDQNQNPLLLPPLDEEEQFVSAESFSAANTALDWDALASRGNSSCSRAAATKWERESLYVKFDPLVGSRKESSIFKAPKLPGMGFLQGLPMGPPPPPPVFQQNGGNLAPVVSDSPPIPEEVNGNILGGGGEDLEETLAITEEDTGVPEGEIPSTPLRSVDDETREEQVVLGGNVEHAPAVSSEDSFLALEMAALSLQSPRPPPQNTEDLSVTVIASSPEGLNALSPVTPQQKTPSSAALKKNEDEDVFSTPPQDPPMMNRSPEQPPPEKTPPSSSAAKLEDNLSSVEEIIEERLCSPVRNLDETSSPPPADVEFASPPPPPVVGKQQEVIMLDEECPPDLPDTVSVAGSLPQSPNSVGDGDATTADSSLNTSSTIAVDVTVIKGSPAQSQVAKARAISQEKRKQKQQHLDRVEALLAENVEAHVKQNERHQKVLEERNAASEERKEAQKDLAKAETRFAEMLMLYETVKDKTTKVEQNHVILQKREEYLVQSLQKRDEKDKAIDHMHAEVTGRMKADFEGKIKEKDTENTKLRAKIRMAEMKIGKLEGEITQVDRESDSLRKLCEDLMKG